MHIYEKDFRYLLQYLVPLHRLPPAIRRDVEGALTSGSSADLRRASVSALEKLVDANYLERGEVTAQNGDVIVPYRRLGGRYQLSVSVPRQEWPHDEPRTERAEPSLVMPPAGAVMFLPEIIRTFTLTDRTDPVLDRLEALLETLGEWLDLRGIELDVVDEVVGRSESVGRRVRVIDEDELRGSELNREVLESGTQRFVSGSDALPEGAPPGSTLGIAPIFHMGKVDGLLRVVFGDDVERATMNRQLDVCASVVRQVVEFHEQFETLTSIDALTGIYNRNFFDRQLPVEVERAMRSGSEVSLLVMDIDDFKKINDELGHRKGDEALGVVADLVRENLRKVDTPFRYGGEEIVVLLPGTSEVESVHTAERLRRVIAQHSTFRDLHEQPRQITVSVGVSVYPDTAKTAESLFVQADAAMYRAKQLGKNRVILYKDDMERTERGS